MSRAETAERHRKALVAMQARWFAGYFERQFNRSHNNGHRSLPS